MTQPDTPPQTRRETRTALSLFILTLLAMIAFAGNSVIARMALLDPVIDPLINPVIGPLIDPLIEPWRFTLIRIVSGALMLAVIVTVKYYNRRGRHGRNTPAASPRNTGYLNYIFNLGHWRGGLALLGYAALFSLAYVSLATGTGALILFACVQVTMITGGLLRGERLRLRQWAGLFFALLGLVILLSPSADAPSPLGGLMMVGSGIAWGVYSLMGQGSARRSGPNQDPIHATTGHFLRAAVIALIISVPVLYLFPSYLGLAATDTQMMGVIYAVISGTMTSGLGYVIWYAALKHLAATRAAIAQLSVPLIAALGGALLLSEPITGRFVLASLIGLGGIALAVFPHCPKP